MLFPPQRINDVNHIRVYYLLCMINGDSIDAQTSRLINGDILQLLCISETVNNLLFPKINDCLVIPPQKDRAGVEKHVACNVIERVILKSKSIFE